jgi:hypothetical protein
VGEFEPEWPIRVDEAVPEILFQVDVGEDGAGFHQDLHAGGVAGQESFVEEVECGDMRGGRRCWCVCTGVVGGAGFVEGGRLWFRRFLRAFVV